MTDFPPVFRRYANSGRPWSAEHDAELRRMLAEGVPRDEIARHLRRSRAAVDGRARVLRLSPTPAPSNDPA